MFKWKIAANIAAGVLMVGALGYYNFIDKKAEAGAQKGDKCPDFTAQLYKTEGDEFSLDDKTFTLSDKIGKVCVLNFWETWCGGCIEEMHEFNEVYEEYGDEVEMMAIIGVSSTPNQATNWLNEKKWSKGDPNHDWADFTLPFAYLPTETCAMLGYVETLPRTIVVDKSGYITYGQDGPLSYDELKTLIEEVL